MNKVLIIGNLTRDPEKRYTPSGSAVSEITVAVNRKYKSSGGEMRDEVCFVPVTLWGKTAENAVEFLSKGSQVLVEGRLKLDQWEKDGAKKSKMTVVCESMQFLSRWGRGEASTTAPRGDNNDAAQNPERHEPPAGENSGRPWDAPPANDAPPDDLPF